MYDYYNLWSMITTKMNSNLNILFSFFGQNNCLKKRGDSVCTYLPFCPENTFVANPPKLPPIYFGLLFCWAHLFTYPHFFPKMMYLSTKAKKQIKIEN